MTFEPTRKRQLLVLQPKGKPLYEGDEATKSFGLKMLQSMGWKKGNGLGRTQQGNLDFIQVRYKNNSNGLGFDGLKDNQWTETEASFDNLLKNLNSQSSSNSNSADEVELKKPSKSLEEMSKKSKARVHYKKFTRGKDVYKYSEKDLANILGKKSLKEDVKKDEEIAKPVESEEKPETYKSDLIVNTGVSITEYFNQKRKQKVEKSGDSLIEIAEEVPPEKNKKQSKKDKNKREDMEMEPSATHLESENIIDKQDEVKEKKKKRKKEQIESEQVEELEIPKKKKKKSKKQEQEEEILVEEEEKVIGKKNKKRKEQVEGSETPVNDVSSNKPESSNVQLETNQKTNSNDVDRPRGANAVYSTDVVLIPSHVAQKMTSVLINNFNNSNLGDIIGYGMTDDIEIKVVETKMGGQISNDKYALYNTDRITKPRINNRKILTKIKKTKKSIQVI